MWACVYAFLNGWLVHLISLHPGMNPVGFNMYICVVVGKDAYAYFEDITLSNFDKNLSI